MAEGHVPAGKSGTGRGRGVGGMGVGVKARNLRLETPVAFKFMFPERLGDAEGVSRFKREARAAARLRGEHVARVTDVGELENGAPYMVMEFLEGRDLADHVEKQGPLPLPEAAEYVIQACEALEEAHDKGIVHRDIKPQNIFITRKPNGAAWVKVLDFGISKLTTASGSAGTGTGQMMGTAMYMAPEQMRSTKNVDARADIWSMGVTLYELVTGELPFPAESIVEACFKIASEPPVPPTKVRAEVGAELERIILRCLEKDPNARFAKISELSAALAPIAGRSAHQEPRPDLAAPQAAERSSQVDPMAATGVSGGIAAAVSAASGPNTDVSWGNTQNDKAKKEPAQPARRWPLILAAAVAVVGIGAFAISRMGTTPGGANAGSAPAAPRSTSPSKEPATAAPAPTPTVTSDKPPPAPQASETTVGSSSNSQPLLMAPKLPALKASVGGKPLPSVAPSVLAKPKPTGDPFLNPN